MIRELINEAKEKEFRYAINVDSSNKDGKYKSKDFEKIAKTIPGFVALRNSKPGVIGMITITAKDNDTGFDAVNNFFKDNKDWSVEVTSI